MDGMGAARTGAARTGSVVLERLTSSIGAAAAGAARGRDSSSIGGRTGGVGWERSAARVTGSGLSTIGRGAAGERIATLETGFARATGADLALGSGRFAIFEATGTGNFGAGFAIRGGGAAGGRFTTTAGSTTGERSAAITGDTGLPGFAGSGLPGFILESDLGRASAGGSTIAGATGAATTAGGSDSGNVSGGSAVAVAFTDSGRSAAGCAAGSIRRVGSAGWVMASGVGGATWVRTFAPSARPDSSTGSEVAGSFIDEERGSTGSSRTTFESEAKVLTVFNSV